MDIHEKRELARKLHRSATQKISRNKGKGIALAGTEYDVRRDPSKIKRYTGRQLDTYISELSGLVSRKQQFVTDAFNKPLPRSAWKPYKSLETKNKETIDNAFDKVAHLFNPTSGTTLSSRMAGMTADIINAGNRRVNAAYQPVQRNPESITSLKSLKKLTEQMKRQVVPGKHERDMVKSRRNFNKMLAAMNDSGVRGNKAKGIEPVKSLKNLAKGLTQEQFNIIWQYTTLPDMVDYNYQSAMDVFSDKKKDLLNIEDVMAGNRQEIRNLLEWGSSIKFAKKPKESKDPKTPKFVPDSNTVYN